MRYFLLYNPDSGKLLGGTTSISIATSSGCDVREVCKADYLSAYKEV